MFGTLKKIIILIIPILVIWLFALGIKNDFNLSGLRIDMQGTFDRIIYIFNGNNFAEIFNEMSSYFQNLGNTFTQYLSNIGIAFNEIKDVWSFFSAFGTLFEELTNIFIMPFNVIINVIGYVAKFIGSIFGLIGSVFNILLNPITF